MPKDDTEIEVVLLYPHEHAGVEYPHGSKISLPVDSANWLIFMDRAEKARSTGKPVASEAKD